MFERISAGWALTKQAANVLRLDKELLLFPVLSAIACGLVIASFFIPPTERWPWEFRCS